MLPLVSADKYSDYCRGQDCLSFIIETLAHSAAGGGNLDLSVDGMGDGRIPPAFERVLLGVGEWMDVNSQAIYNSTGHAFAPLDNSTCTDNPKKCYTRVGDALYVILLEWPFTADDHVLTMTHKGAAPTAQTRAQLLTSKDGSPLPDFAFTHNSSGLFTTIPPLWPSQMPLQGSATSAYVLRYSHMAFAPAVDDWLASPPVLVMPPSPPRQQ